MPKKTSVRKSRSRSYKRSPNAKLKVNRKQRLIKRKNKTSRRKRASSVPKRSFKKSPRNLIDISCFIKKSPLKSKDGFQKVKSRKSNRRYKFHLSVE